MTLQQALARLKNPARLTPRDRRDIFAATPPECRFVAREGLWPETLDRPLMIKAIEDHLKDS